MRKTLFVLLLAAVMMLFAVSCAEEAHEHSWDEGKVTTPATCTDPGMKTYTCECGETKTEAIPALGHNWDEGKITTPATCTDPGVKTYTCQNDKNHTKTEAVAALGHAWDEGKITTPATCTDPGVKTYTCQNDKNHTKTEAVAALGHNWDEGKVTTPATCGAEGVKTYTCQNDKNHTKTESIPATGEHTWGDWVNTTPATILAEGEDTRTCSVCEKKETRPVAKLALEVSTFEEFVAAFAIEREAGTPYTIKLTADLAWDAVTYTKDNHFAPDMTGITLDLNNHSITGMISTAFAPTGNSFTIKNGTLSLAAATNTYQKSIVVGWTEAVTGKDYTSEAEQAKAITFDSVSFNASPYIGDGVFIFNNCSIIGADAKNNRGLVCYSGYVELNDTTVKSLKHGSDAAEVAIYMQETVLKLNGETVIDSANHGIQAYNCSSVITTGNVTIKAAGNYAIYTNYAKVKSADAVIYANESGVYHNVVNIGTGATISGAVKGVFAMTFGDQYTIAAGVTITGPSGTAEPKYEVTSVSKAVGTANSNGYIGWSGGKGSDAGAATLTDNRE